MIKEYAKTFQGWHFLYILTVYVQMLMTYKTVGDHAAIFV